MGAKDKELTGVKEIARIANVSIGTVDRVIHDRKGVSKATRDKINGIIKELDYQPNIFARRLASKKEMVFAVLIPEVSDETDFWDAPLTGVKQAAEEVSPYGIKVVHYLYELKNRNSFQQQIDKIDLSKTEGVLIAPIFTQESVAFITLLESRKIPYVFINSDIQGYESLGYFGPDLYQSGYLSAHLMRYLLKKDEAVLLINISYEIDNQHHLLRKEEGFRNYFTEKGLENPILKVDIRQTDYPNVGNAISDVLKDKSIGAIFVTNSRVSTVAKYLSESQDSCRILVGFDFTKENVALIKAGKIDFLICQKPREQAYMGIIALYQFVVHSKSCQKNNYMPIDIITRENCDYYIN